MRFASRAWRTQNYLLRESLCLQRSQRQLSDEELEAEAKKIVEDYVGDQVDADKKAEMLNTLLKDNRDNLVYQVKLMKAQDIIINSMVLK